MMAELKGLRKYVTYEIQVLAYTRIGDGALSVPPVSVQTFEDGEQVFFLVLSQNSSPEGTFGRVMKKE